MKELWIQISKNAPDKEKLNKLATELGDAVLDGECVVTSGKETLLVTSKFDAAELKELKKEDKKVVLRVAIHGKEDENNAGKAAEQGVDAVVINCQDWRVIPLENVIAKTRGKSKLIAEVTNASDAKLVLETLELGTDGVLLTTDRADEICKTAEVVKQQAPKLALTIAKILAVKPLGTGARACIDTCDLMAPGEGIIIGSQSAGLFLVEAEVNENPYVASRPFRVNAGSISMYTLGSMENTRYLSEFKAGDEVIIINRQGQTRKANIGRVKIEFRPLILIEAEANGKHIKTILQNAETIRLVTPKGSTPVTALKAGDEVMVHVAAKGGRHFGVSVTDETVIER